MPRHDPERCPHSTCRLCSDRDALVDLVADTVAALGQITLVLLRHPVPSLLAAAGALVVWRLV